MKLAKLNFRQVQTSGKTATLSLLQSNQTLFPIKPYQYGFSYAIGVFLVFSFFVCSSHLKLKPSKLKAQISKGQNLLFIILKVMLFFFQLHEKLNSFMAEVFVTWKLSPLICTANQWTVFYMIGTSVMKELKRD